MGLKTSMKIDESVVNQKCIMNQKWDEHRRTSLCTRCDWDTGEHCRNQIEIFESKEFAEAEVVIMLVKWYQLIQT